MRTPPLDLIPIWSERPLSDETGSRDPLGFQRYAALFAERILPDITVLTLRARQFAFMCWSIHEIQLQAEIRWLNGHPITNDQFIYYYNRFEKVLALSEAALHQEDDKCRWIGMRKTRGLLKGRPPKLSLDFQLIGSEDRGGGLTQYQSTLIRLGLVQQELEKAPLVTTEKGTELAKTYADAIGKHKSEIRDFVFDGSRAYVSCDQLEIWASRICLSKLSKPEATVLRPIIVSGERAETRFVLKTVAHWSRLPESEILRRFYSLHKPKGREFDLQQIQFYEYFFVAYLSLFYKLMGCFDDVDQTRTVRAISKQWLKEAGLTGKELVKDTATISSNPASFIGDDKLAFNNPNGWVNALCLWRTVWSAAKRRLSIADMSVAVNSLRFYEAGSLIDRFSEAPIADLLPPLFDQLLTTHKQVFDSKNKASWITRSGSDISVHDFELMLIRDNPYGVHLTAFGSLNRDLDRVNG